MDGATPQSAASPLPAPLERGAEKAWLSPPTCRGDAGAAACGGARKATVRGDEGRRLANDRFLWYAFCARKIRKGPCGVITLIIPAYNESAILADTIRQADAWLAGAFSDYELLIVDDGSTDGTAEIARAAASPRVRLISYAPNAGKGHAVREGMRAARGDVIYYTDADLAYGLDVLGTAHEALEASGCDIVLGSRRLDREGYAHYPLIRRLASRTFALLAHALSGLPYDTQCGLKGFRRETGQAVFRHCETDRFAFDFEALMIARRLGCAVTQIPVHIINHRDSKVNVLKDSVRMFRDVLRIRRSVNRRAREGVFHD